MRRLAALIPRPRPHLIRFHGMLAPNAELGAQVAPWGSDERANASGTNYPISQLCRDEIAPFRPWLCCKPCWPRSVRDRCPSPGTNRPRGLFVSGLSLAILLGIAVVCALPRPEMNRFHYAYDLLKRGTKPGGSRSCDEKGRWRLN